MDDDIKTARTLCVAGGLDPFKEFVASACARHSLPDAPALLDMIVDANGRTCLHTAAVAGSTDIMAYCLDTQPGLVNRQDREGVTALSLAVARGKPETVELLLARKADTNILDEKGISPLHKAAGQGNTAILKLLHGSGCDMSAKSELGTALHWAVNDGHRDAIELLCDLSVPIDEPNSQGWAPILFAALRDKLDCVALLASKGASVAAPVAAGMNVLHMCARANATDAIRTIVEQEEGKKAAAARTSDGHPPVFFVALKGNTEAVRLLAPHSEEPFFNGCYDDLVIEAYMEEAKQKKILEQASQIQSEGGHLQGEEGRAAPPRNLQPASVEARASASRLKDEGNALFNAGDAEGAVKMYSCAINLDPMNAVLWSNRSAAHMQLSNFEAACKDAMMCRQLRPDWTRACYRLAAARLALGQFEDAGVAAWEGMQLDPNDQQCAEVFEKAIKQGRIEHAAKKQ